MKTIHKFLLDITEINLINVSDKKGKIVLLEIQEGIPCIWLETDKDLPKICTRIFRVYGTGFNIPDGQIHVGSYQDGEYVWHVYEQIDSNAD